eukprot:2480470-Rhodomonas_salina.3
MCLCRAQYKPDVLPAQFPVLTQAPVLPQDTSLPIFLPRVPERTHRRSPNLPPLQIAVILSQRTLGIRSRSFGLYHCAGAKKQQQVLGLYDCVGMSLCSSMQGLELSCVIVLCRVRYCATGYCATIVLRRVRY